jgi:hypothetical protein
MDSQERFKNLDITAVTVTVVLRQNGRTKTGVAIYKQNILNLHLFFLTTTGPVDNIHKDL